MISRGQFWSIDIVLAAAIFTLALGLVLSSTELTIFYGQQEKNTRQLLSAAIASSNYLASQSDFWVQYTPAVCDIFLGGDPSLCNFSACQGAMCTPNIIDLEGTVVNLRCGPNFEYFLEDIPACDPTGGPCSTAAPDVIPRIRGWLSDNELSSLENCIIDYRTPFRGTQAGIQAYYYTDMNARMVDGNTIHYYMAKGKGEPTFTISRRMLIFPYPLQPDANNLRECLDGNCGQYLTDLNVRLWRT